MFQRIDKLQVDLPKNVSPDPAAAAAVQELMGGRFGEMSTLNNYMYQSFNMRGRDQILPFYDLVASITAEEFGHVELVAATINLLQNGGEPDNATPDDSPLTKLNGGNGIRHQFLNNGNSALAADAQGAPWRGTTFSAAETSSWTCCTISSWKAARAWASCASTRAARTLWSSG